MDETRSWQLAFSALDNMASASYGCYALRVSGLIIDGRLSSSETWLYNICIEMKVAVTQLGVSRIRY